MLIVYSPYLPITHLVTPALALCPTQIPPSPYSITLSSLQSLSHLPSHYLHIINLSSPSIQLPVPLPSILPIFISSSCILHLSISHSSRSSPSLTQDLTNPPGRPSYTELPRPVEVNYEALFLVSWAPPHYTANVSSVQYRVYYPNDRVIDTPTNTTEVLGVAPGRLISEIAVISPNKEVISERGPVGRSETLDPFNFRCRNKGEKYSIDFYSTSTLLNVDIPNPHTLCVN